MTKILNFSLLGLFLLQLLVAMGFELSHDEAYYWLYSQHLDWGYFDHPPVVGIIIKLFSFLPHSEISVRLGFILLQFGAVWMLMKNVVQERQWLVVALFFAFPLASFSGILALPDLPLLFMTTLYCVLLKRFLDKADLSIIAGLALVISMLLYSKYHGILVVFFTILALPSLLKKKEFYLVALLSLVLFLPHLIWQYQHDFSTLRYHFFERPKVDFSLKRLFEYSMTQIFLAGLFVGPLIWWNILKNKAQSDFRRALKAICICTVIFFFVSTFSKKFEANWTIFLAAPLILLTAEAQIWNKKWAKTLLFVSLGIVLISRVLLTFEPSTISIKRLSEFHGWRDWSKEINEKCQHPIMANTYQVASKLAFYLHRPVHALNYHSRKNQFDYWEKSPQYYPTDEVCYVTDKKEFEGEILLTPEGKKMRLVPVLDLSKLRSNYP